MDDYSSRCCPQAGDPFSWDTRYSRTVPALGCDSNISTDASSRFTCGKRHVGHPSPELSEEVTQGTRWEGDLGMLREGQERMPRWELIEL